MGDPTWKALLLQGMVMIGKLLSAVAGQSIARTVGGAGAGPVGAVLGSLVPTILPAVARRLGPAGMVAAAVGSFVVARAMARRGEKTASGSPPPPPTA